MVSYGKRNKQKVRTDILEGVKEKLLTSKYWVNV